MKTIEEALKTKDNVIDRLILQAYENLRGQKLEGPISIESIVELIDRWSAADGTDYWKDASDYKWDVSKPDDYDAACNYVRYFSYHAGSKEMDNVEFERFIDENLLESDPLVEKYSEEELDKMIGKVFNIQKIDNIFNRKKYNEKRLFAHTVCTKCGRDKTVFLSNLVNDPDKYGSCICSDTNIEAKIDNIQKLYSGRKKLSSNTSGYTGVSFVKTYKGEPYNKWRAYIEVDGVRTYLGDFTSKSKAIKARKEAGEKGIKWYKNNRNKLMRDVRRRSKKFKTSKYRETQKTRSYAKVK